MGSASGIELCTLEQRSILLASDDMISSSRGKEATPSSDDDTISPRRRSMLSYLR